MLIPGAAVERTSSMKARHEAGQSGLEKVGRHQRSFEMKNLIE